MKSNSKSKNIFEDLNIFYYTIFVVLFVVSAFHGLIALFYLRTNFFEQTFLTLAVMLILTVITLLIAIFRSLCIKKIRYWHNIYENRLADIRKELLKKEALLSQIAANNDKIALEYSTKAEFFTNLTHDMKTPLSVILGVIQLLENTGSNQAEGGKTLRYFRQIKQNCYRLLRLVNNILDISKLESGYIKINQENCNIVCLAGEITQSIIPVAEQKSLTVNFGADMEEIITAVDVEKMERILLNLLSNAIKFTNEGGKIDVYVQKRKETVAILVRDSGRGIPESMQSVIFERFKQVDRGITRDSEGSGIGLAIAKSFAELHGGSISVISKEEKGSTFIVEVPLKLCHEEKVLTTNSDSFSRTIDAVKIELSDIYTVA